MTTKEKRLVEESIHDQHMGKIALAVAALLLLLSSVAYGVLYTRSISDSAAIDGLKSGFDNTRALLDQLCDKGANPDTAQCRQASVQPDTSAQVAKDGRPGKDGRDGLPGNDGLRGLTGKTGLQGLIGLTKVGTDGTNGTNGIDGVGTNGTDGTDGTDGNNGTNGSDGRGVSSVSCGNDGVWTISYTDGTSQTASGPCRAESPGNSPTPDPTPTPTASPSPTAAPTTAP